jgi:hypothetical protein
VGRTANISARAVAVAVVSAVLGACGGGDTGSSTENCGGVIGLAAPPCTCTSWTNYVIPTSDFYPNWPGELPDWAGPLVLVPDLSTSPPHAPVKAGVSFKLSVAVLLRRPFDCNQGFESTAISWSSSDPTVASFQGLSGNVAIFVARNPGEARLSAGNLVAPGRRIEQVGLSTCSTSGGTGSLQDGFVCTSRVPLTIRVVP